MFLFENFDIGGLNSLYELANEFFQAVSDALTSLLGTLQVFLQLFVSFFNRLSTTNTSMYSFVIIFFAAFIVFSIIKIWRS